MATTSIGVLYSTAIPGYADSADIQAALRAYHYGSYTFDTAETDPAELINPHLKEKLFNALINNIEYFFLTTIFITLGALIISILVTRKFRGARFFRTITFLPSIVAILVVGFLFSLINRNRFVTI
jgi:ABC-type sugar transport system permease subunit